MASSEINPAIIEQVKLSQAPVPWCPEFEKMISGMPFRAANDPKMPDHKFKIMKQLHIINSTSSPETDTFQSFKASKQELISQIMGRYGEGTYIEPPFFYIWGCNIFLGEGVYMNRQVSIHDNAPVHIGNNVLIGPEVTICPGTHDTDLDIRRGSGTSFAHPIVIEDDCWIGMRVTILPGVRIGKGTTIAAGAVVVKDIEAHVVAGGVPAKVIKYLGDSTSTMLSSRSAP